MQIIFFFHFPHLFIWLVYFHLPLTFSFIFFVSCLVLISKIQLEFILQDKSEIHLTLLWGKPLLFHMANLFILSILYMYIYFMIALILSLGLCLLPLIKFNKIDTFLLQLGIYTLMHLVHGFSYLTCYCISTYTGVHQLTFYFTILYTIFHPHLFLRLNVKYQQLPTCLSVHTQQVARKPLLGGEQYCYGTQQVRARNAAGHIIT